MTALFSLLLAAAFPARAAGIVAGSVVSSKEWKVRRGAEKEEEFIGDVRYRNRSTVLTAEWALFRHATETWEIRDRVRIQKFLPDGDVVEAGGDHANFVQKTGKGDLTGHDGVVFQRKVQGAEPDHGSATRVEWEAGHHFFAVGAVRVWGPRLEASGDRADYDLIPGRLQLTGGRPVLLKLEGFDAASSDWVGALQGDVVTADETAHRLSADGKTRGWLDFQQPAGSKDRDPASEP